MEIGNTATFGKCLIKSGYICLLKYLQLEFGGANKAIPLEMYNVISDYFFDRIGERCAIYCVESDGLAPIDDFNEMIPDAEVDDLLDLQPDLLTYDKVGLDISIDDDCVSSFDEFLNNTCFNSQNNVFFRFWDFGTLEMLRYEISDKQLASIILYTGITALLVSSAVIECRGIVKQIVCPDLDLDDFYLNVMDTTFLYTVFHEIADEQIYGYTGSNKDKFTIVFDPCFNVEKNVGDGYHIDITNCKIQIKHLEK